MKGVVMIGKHTLPLVGAAAAAAVAVAAASGGPAATHASVVIRHQTHGCHAWSVNGGALKATQSAALPRGGSITVVNNDVMPQTLVKKSGPAVRFTGKPAMTRVGAAVTVAFPKAGVYRFVTRFGEDYPWASKLHTVGEDNVLRLIVTVS
jgi:hypothetical protein